MKVKRKHFYGFNMKTYKYLFLKANRFKEMVLSFFFIYIDSIKNLLHIV